MKCENEPRSANIFGSQSSGSCSLTKFCLLRLGELQCACHVRNNSRHWYRSQRYSPLVDLRLRPAQLQNVTEVPLLHRLNGETLPTHAHEHAFEVGIVLQRLQ